MLDYTPEWRPFIQCMLLIYLNYIDDIEPDFKRHELHALKPEKSNE